MSPRRTLFLLVVLAVSAPPARAQQRDSIEALKHLTLDQLMNIDVMSVSLRPQRLFETPSAIQVITQDDIRASGATSLPEALRLASNLQVAQVDAQQWAISARGFNGTTANKLLVLIDGRTLHTALFGRLLGCARRPSLGRGPDRGDQRTRGNTVGRQRGQWRDQRDHEGRERHGGTPGYGRWRHRAARPGIRPLRRRARRARQLSDLRQGLQS